MNAGSCECVNVHAHDLKLTSCCAVVLSEERVADIPELGVWKDC